ncbi:proteasome accessory factor PafA2 [Sesbania bispinosa]|nr:proteasome accessory factor PafA2 [Sesbania bispinosa]
MKKTERKNDAQPIRGEHVMKPISSSDCTSQYYILHVQGGKCCGLVSIKHYKEINQMENNEQSDPAAWEAEASWQRVRQQHEREQRVKSTCYKQPGRTGTMKKSRQRHTLNMGIQCESSLDPKSDVPI